MVAVNDEDLIYVSLTGYGRNTIREEINDYYNGTDYQSIYLMGCTSLMVRYWRGVDSIYLVDNSGFMVGKDKVRDLIKELELFIARFPENVIKENHRVAENRMNGDYSDYNYDTAETSPKPYKDKKGYVYFVSDGNGYVKIGKTKNMKVRMGEYTQLPKKPKVINVLPVIDCAVTEKFLHNHFDAKRVRGEWFRLDKSDLKTIRALKDEFYTVESLAEAIGGDLNNL